MSTGDSKTCTRCGEAKPMTEFWRRHQAKDGLAWECKTCAYLRTRASRKRYRERNKKALATAWSEWYAKNYESVAARSKAWRDANPEKKRAQRDPEKMRLDGQRRRTRELNAYVEDVPLDFLLLRDLGVCGICKKQIMEDTIERDHIIPIGPPEAGGRHEKANMQLAHRTCNRRKHAKVNFTLEDAA